MKTTNTLSQAQHTLVLNCYGQPLVAEYFGGSYGVGAAYLTADGRICSPNREGGNYRDVRETDRLFDAAGNLFPI